jgi:hypothetical protein
MSQPSWKLPLFLLTVGSLASTAAAVQAENSSLENSNASTIGSIIGSTEVAQVVLPCEYGNYPSYYSRVDTDSDPLALRRSPNGTIVNTVPDGWTVSVLEWSQDGAWARVLTPNYQNGWVSAAYLKDLGRFCEKPVNVSQMLAPEILGENPIEVQGDVLAMGDRLAELYNGIRNANIRENPSA